MPSAQRVPQHLQGYTHPCPPDLAAALRGCVDHPVTVAAALACGCAGDAPVRAPAERRRPRSSAAGARAAGFSVDLNEEAGVVRASCRRCVRPFVVFDRARFWGVPPAAVAPPVWPCRCRCGKRLFDVALGMDYEDDALDDNDVEAFAVVLRCVACGTVMLILDEEGL